MSDAFAGRVAGKIAFVTGAASGIGRATAVRLAREGAAVGCADLHSAGAEETVGLINSDGSSAWAVTLDVASESGWEDAVNATMRRRGRLDVVVNCAGISFAAPVTEMTLEQWHRVMSVNLDGVFLGTKHAVGTMRQTGGGSIVNVASVSGVKAQPEASAYSASKAAIIMFSRCIALECLHRGDQIRVNSVSPSGVKTPMWRTMPFFQEMMEAEGGEEAAFEAMARTAPQNRWALPEEVAAAILYLASDEASYITGTNLVFDAGYTA